MLIEKESPKEAIPPCDNLSVGLLVFNPEGRLLLLKRRRYPQGFAPPAGHLDGDTFKVAAKRELYEETGIQTDGLWEIVCGKMENPCRRPGGTFHFWRIYYANLGSSPQVKMSLAEAEEARWCSQDDISALAGKTEELLNGTISQDDFAENPGLEPVWYFWFQRLGIIPDIKERKIPSYLRGRAVIIAGRYYGEEFGSVVEAANAFQEVGISVYPHPETCATVIESKTSQTDNFVFLGGQENTSFPYKIELGYLRALQNLQKLPPHPMFSSNKILYVAVHNGYLGRSASIETAYAMALGKPIVFAELPQSFSSQLPCEITKIITRRMRRYPVVPIQDIRNRLEEIFLTDTSPSDFNDKERMIVFSAILSLIRDLRRNF